MILGVDIGASNLRVGLGTKEGELLERRREPTVNSKDPDDLLNQVKRMATQISGSFDEIVIGGAGRIKGKTLFPPNLRYKKIPLKPLEKELGAELKLYNDTVLAAKGEREFGVARNRDNFIYLTLSTGVGAGVYVDGKLLKGRSGNAGEVGHFIINYDSTPREWEEFVSGSALPQFLRKNYDKEWGCKEFFRKVRKGSKMAKRALEEIARINAVGIANMVNAYEPSLIVLGGGLIVKREGDSLMKKIKNKLPKWSFNEVPEIQKTQLGDSIVLYGTLV